MVKIWFDGKLDLRTGDNIKILRGQKDSDIRASFVENLTTGVIQRSHIEGVLMTKPIEKFNPPIIGRVENIEIEGGYTRFDLEEGIITTNQTFVKAGDTEKAEIIIKDIFSKQTSGYVKIVDSWISNKTLELLESVPSDIKIRVICRTINNKENFLKKLEQLKKSGKNIEIRKIEANKIHGRYILTVGKGWTIDHSLDRFGMPDSQIQLLTEKNIPEKIFDERWEEAKDI